MAADARDQSAIRGALLLHPLVEFVNFWREGGAGFSCGAIAMVFMF